jgi:hypothetical protein
MSPPTPGASPDPNIEKHDRDLFRVMSTATALGFGTLAAFLVSLRHIRDDVSLEFGFSTVLAFVAGAAAGWGVWEWIRRRAAAEAAKAARAANGPDAAAKS